MAAAEPFDRPWPGPGNSDGPVNPDGWEDVNAVVLPREPVAWDSEVTMLFSSPWPGPGNSEA